MSEFVTVTKLAEVAKCGHMTVRVGSREVALFKLGDTVFALDGRCPHRGGSLGEGIVESGSVFCPLHGWQFDVKTGACFNNPERPATYLPVRVVDGEVQVQL